VNTGASWPDLYEARLRVLGIQTKLHRWAAADSGRRFDDLFNLVADPAFLVVAWDRVHTNAGGRTAGVDGITATMVKAWDKEIELLADIRACLKDGSFRPLPVRERAIPKPGGKLRKLGIPTIRDRIVQAALKLVLEPIFEADFHPCSYGFRPRRRAQDAIAEIHYLNSANRQYRWVLEADIEACFDSIDHTALMDRVRRRVGDKRVLRLVKAFLKAGIMTAEKVHTDSKTGTPQGGILSPLLANIALSALDEYFAEQTRQHMATSAQRAWRKYRGMDNWRLIRYADDFVVLVDGNRDHAEALRDQIAEVLAPLGLRLAPAKTQVVHIDDGFDFLGWRIQRRRKPGTVSKHYVYTWPSKKAFTSIKAKIRALTRNNSPARDLKDLLWRLNAALRGWCVYFQHGVSYKTFSYLTYYTWHKVTEWIRKRHHRISWKQLWRRFLLPGGRPAADGIVMFYPTSIPITRYRYRGYKIPTPWTETTPA
jgi:RNA-directed DNA polymerase